MVIETMAQELYDGMLVGVVIKEKSEVEGQLELNFEVEVCFNGKQQQPNSISEGKER